MIKAVLIDDEPRGSKLLQHKLESYADSICIQKIFSDPFLAIKEIPDLEPDVLFLDVEMPRMSGFQLLEHLASFSFEVIFVTAYNSYTLKALRASALDYLLKPVNSDELEIAMQKLQSKIRSKEQVDLVEKLASTSSSKVALPTAEGIHLVKKEDIIKIEAMSNYSVFYLTNLTKIIVSKTLKEFEKVLCESQFFRVNRSVIVNMNFIVKYKKGDGGTIILLDESEIEVSPNKKTELLTLLFS